ncbi:TIGR03084 family metal-binding protein [Actinoallomurus purpureus]|uniref:TIGR03084 family metal-binding protein n=1 Tax=Actinoallomurus purpureus TaxID=478114 RepID=UPI00209343DA|nr:TIGR03084 family metal-binding protein [Actinoallomurus purpureus]MCO6010453.1 TIGR03084 family metal-binding protein [Actinoallomurus purpureus]
MTGATAQDGLWADLESEGESVDWLVASLADPAEWRRPTPAEGWTVAHQIGHLAWTDRISLLAVRDPQEFAVFAAAAAGDPKGAVEAGAAEGTVDAGPKLLARWREGRHALVEALARADPDRKLPWFGPPMKPTSMATARLMETYAHGQDIADALSVERPATARLRHICHLGVRTRDYAHRVRGLPVPSEAFRVELTGPHGEEWNWGPEGAVQSVRGRALDFALLVTRRRHRTDLGLAAVGDDANRWLDIAQAFAGDPGKDPAPGSQIWTVQHGQS